MSDDPIYKRLFRIPAAGDKLAFLQDLSDSSDLNADLALAFLKDIHRELASAAPSDRKVYRRYAHMIELLRSENAELLQQVVAAWERGRETKGPEWLSDGLVK